MAGITFLATILYFRFVEVEGGSHSRHPSAQNPPTAPFACSAAPSRGSPKSLAPRLRHGHGHQPGLPVDGRGDLRHAPTIVRPGFPADVNARDRIVFSVALAAEFLVLYPAGSLSDRRGRRYVLLPSLAALAVTTVAVGWAESPLGLGIVVALLGIASGFAGVPPAAMLADVIPEHQSGQASASFASAATRVHTRAPGRRLHRGRARLPGGVCDRAIPTIAALVLVARGEETLHSREASGVTR